MATQSFIKSFSVNKKNAKKMERVLNSRKKLLLQGIFLLNR
jgi:hypothetical protein